MKISILSRLFTSRTDTMNTLKIDGIVAMIMALDSCIRNKGVRGKSVYDERGLLVF